MEGSVGGRAEGRERKIGSNECMRMAALAHRVGDLQGGGHVLRQVVGLAGKPICAAGEAGRS